MSERRQPGEPGNRTITNRTIYPEGMEWSRVAIEIEPSLDGLVWVGATDNESKLPLDLLQADSAIVPEGGLTLEAILTLREEQVVGIYIPRDLSDLAGRYWYTEDRTVYDPTRYVKKGLSHHIPEGEYPKAYLDRLARTKRSAPERYKGI